MNRMIAACLSLLFAGMAAETFAQGSLTPPAGAPVPSMKTLEQVEPRTPICTAGFTISQPGSYYLTTNLTASASGIEIYADGVTLDLMGFALSGSRTPGYYGVYLGGAAGAPIRNVIVRNGIIRNFDSGILASRCQGARLEQLMLSSNLYSGVTLYGQSGLCENTVVRDCTINKNALYGIFFFGQSGVCDGNTIADCALSGNGLLGVYLSSGSGGRCNGNVIRDCAISGNASGGVQLFAGTGQCEGNLLSGCTINKNGVRGVWLDGANGNRLEGNHIVGQVGAATTGIECSGGARNVILCNTCVGQTNNFSLSSSDTYGPIVTASGALSTTNGAAGLSPWANFSR